MPASSTTALFFSSSRNNSQSSFRTSTFIDPFAMDSLESKARIDFERERKRAHKGHDIRRKHSGHSIKSNHSATHAHKRPGPALGQGNWRNSKITMDDMEHYDVMDGDDDFGNKENSRPPSRPVSVSLEELVIRPIMPSSKKLRESVSRTSLSRQASTDSLATALANVSLIIAQPAASVLPPISEHHSRSSSSMDSDSDASILLSPMLPPSDYDSSTDDDLDDFDLQLDFPSFDDEFSSPAVWTVAEAEDGAPQFRSVVNPQTSSSLPPSSHPRCSTTSSAFASSSYW